VAVTGARGFVGRSVVRVLREQGVENLGLVRGAAQDEHEISVGDLVENAIPPLPPARALIHLAGRAHVMRETEGDVLAAYRRVNLGGTRTVLRAARDAAVQRFIFVSTIKVLGEETAPGTTFTQDSVPCPADPYAASKLEAEQEVIRFCRDHGIEWTIVRPVLVFGRGVGANFAQLLRLVHRQLPLPFAAIRNARSLLSVDNLSAFLVAAIDHPALANRVVNLADSPALSTPQLVRALADGMGQRALLVPCPPRLLEIAAGALGRAAAARRLTRSLQVDTQELFQEMRWQPPARLEAALRETASDAL
jgi:nucleoside-diphosphate-sugar epimerase